jgi:hypothetical protein
VPIRTNRGRAAVYRKLWGWPLRSPRHLVALCLVVLAFVLFLGYILPRLTGGSSAAQSTAATTTSGSSTATSSTSQTPTQGATGVVPPPPVSPSLTETRQPVSENKTPARADPQALSTAKNWATAFVKHDGVSPQQWLDALKPLTTDEYYATTITKIDPAVIAAKKITGDPEPTPDSYTSSVTVEVPTDAKKLSITLVKTTAGWRVNEHDEVG